MYQTRSLDVRSQSFDFKRAMGIEGGATNAAPYVIGGNKAAGSFTFGLLFNSPSYGGMDFSDTMVKTKHLGLCSLFFVLCVHVCLRARALLLLFGCTYTCVSMCARPLQRGHGNGATRARKRELDSGHYCSDPNRRFFIYIFFHVVCGSTNS